MRPKITKAEAHAWMRRWEIVNEAEREELRKTPIATKLRQLAAMMAMAEALGWRTSTAAEINAIRGRWARLKRKPRAAR